ncbi:hypothetical protein KRP22_001897 [Phytophthora ramorum]|nr:hypothetical protein KRP22_1180 [Phytophthora ramorum]
MKVLSENGGDTGAGPRLAHLEQLLQELTRWEECKRQQSVESASVSTRQQLLRDQLLQSRKRNQELAAAQVGRAKLCEEIGTLKQAKDHQAKQLDKYKFDLQASRESQAAMTKKMEELEASTWTAKQQYIRSLASRIKTSALVLQQLHTTNGALFGAQLTEKRNEWEQGNRNERKHIRAGGEKENRVVKGSSEPKHAGSAAVSDHVPREDLVSESAALVAPASTNIIALVEQHKTSLNTSHETKKDEQQDAFFGESERAIEELRSQIAKLKAEHADLNNKYKALTREHNKILNDGTTSAQEIKAKESKIEELLQILEISRSKEHENSVVESTEKSEDSSALDGRLKILEENLAQMNGYADQLEMVIAQCPSCTIKLQNESTQDSITNRAE